jgi:hypothetical protein
VKTRGEKRFLSLGYLLLMGERKGHIIFGIGRVKTGNWVSRYFNFFYQFFFYEPSSEFRFNASGVG